MFHKFFAINLMDFGFRALEAMMLVSLLGAYTGCGSNQSAPVAPPRQSSANGSLTANSCSAKGCPPVVPSLSSPAINGRLGETIEQSITATGSDRQFKVFPSTRTKPADIEERVDGQSLKISVVANKEIAAGYYYVIARDMDLCALKQKELPARCQSLGSVNSEYDHEMKIDLKITSNNTSNSATSTAGDIRSALSSCSSMSNPSSNPIAGVASAVPGIVSGISSGNPLGVIGSVIGAAGSIFGGSSKPKPSISTCR